MHASLHEGSRELSLHAIQVSWIDPGDCTSLSLLDRLLDTLSARERKRHRAFVFDPDRHVYLVAQGFLRATLAQHLGIAPGEIAFEHNRWGRPELARELLPGKGAPRLRFNLSYVRNAAACVVSFGHDCGIDVESVDRLRNPLDLARSVFAESEVADLGGRPRGNGGSASCATGRSRRPS